ncbi:hypothetical protein GDO81_024007 [Engystomops pustulosus]|uniref:Uncharacterized protein n=1 Tax=Engystomops pustulosus TaxID=76066 RepID=A0AAV6Z2D8_ENGPU|nr:hypothetical protein GDO81_024007 [Engystomops pustulosus]
MRHEMDDLCVRIKAFCHCAGVNVLLSSSSQTPSHLGRESAKSTRVNKEYTKEIACGGAEVERQRSSKEEVVNMRSTFPSEDI